jgi:UDP-N-acetylmuramoyl-L-alanyl-D-glutamate--2,6-diaminopimelate ligase
MMMAMSTQAGVTLSDLLDGLVDDALLRGCGQLPLTSVAQDNRKVREGCLFIAGEGFNTHGLLYAVDAVAKGAVAIVWDGDCDRRDEILDQVSNKVACLQCENLKASVGEIAARFYGHPSQQMNVIGITGTDGKTSIAHYVAQALDSYDVHCGVLGTLGNGFINDLHPTGLTTADALEVQSTLADIKQAGARHVVMEVSSHGLDQGRVNAVEFDAAVFSNLAQDHLDYHATKDDYAEAKRRLFFMPGLKVAIINLDDEYGRQLAAECREHLCVWGYSTLADVSAIESLADFMVHAKSVEANENGLDLTVVTPKGSGHMHLALLGQFNASNIMAVLASLLVSGIDFETALQQLQNIQPVSGRMQRVEVAHSDAATVIIDYAHTPQAIAAACKSVREHYAHAFWCVFGCGGDRDKSKRPLMAAAAEQYADHVVVTSDNPRHEDPDVIIEQVFAGFTAPEKHHVEADRKQAIAYALQHAGPDDVVLIAGKGHESSQIVGDVHIAFNDYRIAKELIEAMR